MRAWWDLCWIAFLVGGAIGCTSALAEDDVAHKVLERVFGDAVRLDPAMVAKVRDGKPGERHYVDRDNDGKPEEVWYIDTSPRHPEECRPVLVRAIDEDGDLVMGGEPDLDSDLYVADWKADGVVDAVCDYTDRDGDGDVDEMALYFPGKEGGAAADTVMVWWGDDTGDDNLLWYDIAYTYRQRLCQYRSHFGGDELFCAFNMGLNDSEWTTFWENPFLFYDLDGDGVTEQVIRIGGKNESVENVRYSFDADDDGTLDNPRDFDVSISGHADPPLTFSERIADRRVIRGIPTGPFLDYHATPQWCLDMPWSDLMLTWDENDLNIDGDGLADGKFKDTQERWEGIIAKGNEFFKQIGGPSAGAFNKRYEVAAPAQRGMRLYYAPTDQRIHLLGANHAWMVVDFDCDQRGDMRYDLLDTDGNGEIDTWRLDTNLDGTPEDEWKRGDAAFMGVDYTWPDVKSVMRPLLAAAPEQLYLLDARLMQALAKNGAAEDDAVWALVRSGFDAPGLNEELRLRLLNSNESMRYYLDILKDRLIAALKARYANPDFWHSFDAARGNGDWNDLRRRLEKAFGLDEPVPEWKMFRAGLIDKYRKPAVAWGQDWVPPNIGWESELCAYRAYWGQFDFFGKTRKCLVYPTLAKGGPSYHEEQDWGMDTLHVGTTCGLGGVTLYVNGAPYPVYSPSGKGEIAWTKRLVAEEQGKVVIGFDAANAGPKDHPYSVQFECTAFAGRRDSRIEVKASGGAEDDKLELGIGITKLKDEAYAMDTEAGVLASWGMQDTTIGTIGLGVVFPRREFQRFVDLPDQHQVVVRLVKDAPVVYHIQGDWLNGRRFPRCPGLGDWMKDLRRVAPATHQE